MKIKFHPAYRVKHYTWVFITLVCILIALTGCSTIDGMGKDISSSAQWTKEKMGGSK